MRVAVIEGIEESERSEGVEGIPRRDVERYSRSEEKRRGEEEKKGRRERLDTFVLRQAKLISTKHRNRTHVSHLRQSIPTISIDFY